MFGRILIVDDEPDMLRLFEMMIKAKTAYQVSTTINSAEVAEMVADGGFDMVITDLRMPDKDGIEIIEESREKGVDVPFVVITAYGTIESAIEAMKKGAFDYITKPFRKEQILLTIERAMKFRRLQRENEWLRNEVERLGGKATPE
ncbi:MAG: response regulator [Pseudomonadota bacterium]